MHNLVANESFPKDLNFELAEYVLMMVPLWIHIACSMYAKLLAIQTYRLHTIICRQEKKGKTMVSIWAVVYIAPILHSILTIDSGTYSRNVKLLDLYRRLGSFLSTYSNKANPIKVKLLISLK